MAEQSRTSLTTTQGEGDRASDRAYREAATKHAQNATPKRHSTVKTAKSLHAQNVKASHAHAAQRAVELTEQLALTTATEGHVPVGSPAKRQAVG